MSYNNGLMSILENNQDTFSSTVKMSKQERAAFLESVRKFHEYGRAIYRSGDLKSAITEIENLINIAEQVTIQETEGWFDSNTTSRHMKQLKECMKILKTEAVEVAQRQQRLESAFEDVGQLLGKYYDV